MLSRLRLPIIVGALVMGTIGAAWYCSLAAADDPPPKRDRAADPMKSKLDDSQQILEGLVNEDYEQISSAAERLLKTCKKEVEPARRGKVYRQHTTEFRRTLEKLVKVADQKNADAAALSYLHLTMTCIDCHKFIRANEASDGDTHRR